MNAPDRDVRLAALLDELAAAIERRRLVVWSEIAEYPTPIPGCDADINHLIEVRSRITEELSTLDRLRAAHAAGAPVSAALASLLEGTITLEASTRRRLLDSLATLASA